MKKSVCTIQCRNVVAMAIYSLFDLVLQTLLIDCSIERYFFQFAVLGGFAEHQIPPNYRADKQEQLQKDFVVDVRTQFGIIPKQCPNNVKTQNLHYANNTN